MTSPNNASRLSADSVPAILTLKRFARHGLRQFGFSMVSLVLTVSLAAGMATPRSVTASLSSDSVRVGLSMPLSVEPALQGMQVSTRQGVLSKSLGASAIAVSGQTASKSAVRRAGILRSSLIHHHLTGARLSIAEIATMPTTDVAEARPSSREAISGREAAPLALPSRQATPSH